MFLIDGLNISFLHLNITQQFVPGIQNNLFVLFFPQELYSECDKLRQTVCQMASESEDNDSSLGKNKIHHSIHLSFPWHWMAES